MKLRTPESFWLLKNGILHSYPSLNEDSSCDIAVLGAGITGALISHALLRAGYDTVVIDRRDVGTGSSSATTSMLQYEIDTPLTQLAEMIGEEGAVTCYRAGIESIRTLHALVEKEQIDCGFELKQSLQVSHSTKGIASLKEEYLLRKKHGFQVEWLTSEEIGQRYQMASHPGILSAAGASLDAFQFAHRLLYRNQQRGLRIYDHTDILKIDYQGPVVIETDGGYRLTCKRVVFCTGFETVKMFRKKIADIVTTFALVSEQELNLYDQLKDTLIWDTGDPYIYMRTTDDRRLLIGGEDVPHKYNGFTDKLKNKKANTLIAKVRQLFPTIRFTEDYNWAGAFGNTKDGLPYIGEHPDFPNVIFVLGFGGNGITFSVQGMRLVLKLLAREQNDPLLTHYRFNR